MQDAAFSVLRHNVIDGVRYEITLTCDAERVPAVDLKVVVDGDSDVTWKRTGTEGAEVFISQDGRRERYFAGLVKPDSGSIYVNAWQLLFVDSESIKAALNDTRIEGNPITAIQKLFLPSMLDFAGAYNLRMVPLTSSRNAKELRISPSVMKKDRAVEIALIDLGQGADLGLDRFAAACGI